MIGRLWLALALAAATCGGAHADQEGWRLLRQGGYVALIRHAYAPGTGDPANFRLGDCRTQRNLSAAGRKQARLIGRLFRRNGVAVRDIRSSQWCRCLETGRLAGAEIGRVAVVPTPILNSFFRDRSTAARQTEALRRLIATHPKTGVTLLVTHQVNITALTGVFPRSGEILVLRAGQRQSFRPLARIRTPY